MSISLLLIPAALAAATAVGAAGVVGAVGTIAVARGETPHGATPVAVRTRMKDPDLLAAALADLGATSVAWREGTLTGTVDGVEVELTQAQGGVWGAHLRRLDGRDVAEDEAAALVGRLDAAYAVHVQHTVAERIRAHAGVAGFELVSEARDDDDTITMVLAVKEHA